MITKRKKPSPLPLAGITTGSPVGSTVRDRRPVGPKRGASTRRRTAGRREVGRGRRVVAPASIGLLESLGHSVLAFAGSALAVLCVSSLAGNVVLESARRGTIEARTRLRAETAGREDLKGKLAALASADAVDRWATENGYLEADELPVVPKAGEGRSFVARR